jgi:hypothetical protein
MSYMQRVLSALVDHESTVERGALWSAAFTAGRSGRPTSFAFGSGAVTPRAAAV